MANATRSGKARTMPLLQSVKFNVAADGGAWFHGPSTEINPNIDLPYLFGIEGSPAAKLAPFRESALTTSFSAITSYIRCNVDTHDGWASGANSTAGSITPLAAISSAYYEDLYESASASPYSWQTRLMPMQIGIIRGTTGVSPFGEIRHYRRLSIANYDPADVFTLGDDDWMVFPLYQKSGYSGLKGYAIRKVS